MFGALIKGSVSLCERYLPGPLIFAFLLTLLVFAGALGMGSGPAEIVTYWGEGFWDLLGFSMQMVLILVTGFVLATTPPARAALTRLAKLARGPGAAILLVSLVALIASWINWGFGLVVGALFAREAARQVAGVDYRLLIASAYSGFIVWHGGLSGSVPLTIATPDHFTADLIGVVPAGETIFAPFNLVILAALFILIPLLNRAMMGGAGKPITVEREQLEEETSEAGTEPETPADWLETTPFLSILIAALGLAFLALYFIRDGGGLTLNIVNFAFLMLGILLHGTPRRFLRAAKEAIGGAVGIVIQFPFYAGIMGVMTGSGMAAALSEFFVSISTPQTLPLFTFLSAGILNIFVPSGGGQWGIQSQVMMPAALESGADVARVAMAVAWGDAWTNLVQPFWALPALAIAGLKARDIMGFCLVVLIASGVVIATGLTFL